MVKIRYRIIPIVFIFLIMIVTYMDRTNLSIAILDIGPEFHLSVIEIGLLSSAFFYLYTLFQIPGGIWSERYGPRRIITAAVTWWSTFTILTAAGISFIYLFFVRFMFGAGEAPIFPASADLFSRWLKKYEQTRTWAISLSGMALGPIVGTIFGTYILLTLGWQWIFIIFGIVGLIVVLGFYVLVSDSASNSKHVSKEELNEIISSYVNPEKEMGKTKKTYAPWKKLLKNGRFWAFGWVHFACDYSVYGILTLLPLYLITVRHFAKASLYYTGTLPWIVFITVALISSLIIDRWIKKGSSLFKARVIPAGIGFILSGIFLLWGAYSPSPILAVILISLGMGFIGLPNINDWSLPSNIGGEFSGSYAGWMNFIGNLSGIVGPTLTTVLAAYLGWDVAIGFMGVISFTGAIAYFLMKPDKSFAPGLIPDYTPPKITDIK
ncbi:MAG: MFS transporter [Caldisphaera sp.]